jgi:hypothetical protein
LIALNERKMIVPSRIGLDMVEEKRNFNTPSLKRYLRGLDVLQSGIRAEFKHYVWMGQKTSIILVHQR